MATPPDRGLRAKRAFDLLVAGGALIVLSPLLGIVALLVRRDGGPALHRGQRLGRGGAAFTLLKFRTMAPGPALGPQSTADDDPRITPVGGVLRRYKLDELPQLFNVVRGEMSLVGPRPQIAEDVALYSADERRLLDVPPGMTDFASIRYRNEGEILRGSSDPDRDYVLLIRPEKMRLGLAYVDNRSFWLDLRIIGLTILAIVNHDAAMRALPRVT